jgi:pimeloyl-ACP methyl ester carboxylesterase
VPLLAVWGRNDQIFGPDGALAFGRDLPLAEINLIDGGHFLLESRLDAVASLMRPFLAAPPVVPTVSGLPTARSIRSAAAARSRE